jgi:hypothetical protein
LQDLVNFSIMSSHLKRHVSIEGSEAESERKVPRHHNTACVYILACVCVDVCKSFFLLVSLNVVVMLQAALDIGVRRIIAYGDSEILVNQVSGSEFNPPHSHLTSYCIFLGHSMEPSVNDCRMF